MKKDNEDEEETKEDSEIDTSANIDVDASAVECDNVSLSKKKQW